MGQSHLSCVSRKHLSSEDELKPPDQETAPQGPEEEIRRGKFKFEQKDPMLNLEKVNFRVYKWMKVQLQLLYMSHKIQMPGYIQSSYYNPIPNTSDYIGESHWKIIIFYKWLY